MSTNNLNNEYKPQPIYHQSQHPTMQYMDQPQQYVQYQHPQYNKHYLQSNHQPINHYGIVGQPSTSIDDYQTPSITPNSSISGAMAHNPYHQNIIDGTSTTHSSHYYPLQAPNILPQMNYYSNQHSNKSNNSNSTYISSNSTAQSGNTSINTINSSGFSSENNLQIQMQMQTNHMNNNMNNNMMPSQPLFDIVQSHSHSHSQSNQQAPIQYHPYDIPSYHHQNKTQVIPRSSTTNINIMELDEMARVDDEKKTTDTLSLHHMKSHHSDHTNNTNNTGTTSTHKHTHERQNTRHLELKTFAGDIRAYNTYIACIQNGYGSDVIFFHVLYPKLCEYFIDIVKTAKYPTQNDLRNVFIRNGAIANKYKNDNQTYLSIDKMHFILFWKWFKQCCLILKELRFLWIDNKSIKNKKMNGLGLNFFCQRLECEAFLLSSVSGTFGLRLSSSVCGGIVLSYVENAYNDIQHKLQCKHVILIRQKPGMYLCNKKILSLHDIIRNFVKLKYLYTPSRSIPKNKIF